MSKRTKVVVEKSAVFTGHKDCVYALSGMGNEKKFFSSGSDGMVAQWQADQVDVGTLVAKVQNTVYALHYRAAQNQLVIGENLEGLHVIDLETLQEIRSAKITNAAIFDIKEAEGRLYVACGDGVVIVLDPESLTSIKHLKASEQYARALALHPSLPHLAVGYSDNHIRVFDRNTFEPLHNIAAHENSVFSLTYSPDGNYLLSGSRDAHLKIWGVSGEYVLHQSIVAHMYTINHIAFRQDGKYFATCSKDKSVKVWETNGFQLIKVIDRARHAGHGTSVNKLVWLNQNEELEGQLVSCSDDRSISLWKLKFED